MAISDVKLQSALVLLAHHIKDAHEGCDDKDISYVQKSLEDMKEIVEDLAKDLPKETQEPVEEQTTTAAEWVGMMCKFNRKE